MSENISTKKPASIKKRLILLMILLLTIVISILGVHLYFEHLMDEAFLWHAAFTDKDFAEYEEAFVTVAEFCRDFVEEKKEEQPDSPTYLSPVGISRLCYGGEIIELPEDVNESVKEVGEAFKKTTLFSISCEEDGVYFYTEQGWYTLIYTYDEKKPKNVKAHEHYEAHIKKIKSHWYHVMEQYIEQPSA